MPPPRRAGHALGPDLETVRNFGSQKLLANIIDPSREVAPNYTAYLVQTRKGDTHVGIVAAETADAVTLRMAYGTEVVLPRATRSRRCGRWACR